MEDDAERGKLRMLQQEQAQDGSVIDDPFNASDMGGFRAIGLDDAGVNRVIDIGEDQRGRRFQQAGLVDGDLSQAAWKR